MLDARDSSSPLEIDCVLAEVMAKQERGEHIDIDALLAEHSNIAESLRSYFENAQLFPEILGTREQNVAAFRDDAPNRATEIEIGHLGRRLTKDDRAASDVGEESDESEQMPIEAVRFGGMFGRYRIEKLLGDGGMGAVYLAHDTLLHRYVALKTPKFATHNASRLVERFRREAQAAAKLHHRNICPVHDVGRCEGIDYLTMAYIEGRPLTAYISSRRPLDQRQVALIIRRLALGLQAAHEADVVHRDLKPSNVMIDLQGEPILMDFGLASRIGVSDDSRLTAEGSIVGTPAYMSPEQVRGAKQEIGPQSDIYSLGVMFFEMLTGRLPFRGSTAEVMGKILVAKPPGLQQLRADVDEQIADICERMMSKSRKTRFSSMKEVAEELTEVIRRLRRDDAPKPPVVEDVENWPSPAGNTATELAAIAAGAARMSRRSGRSWRDDSSDSKSTSVWRRGFTWLSDLPTSVGILLGNILTLCAVGLCLVLLSTIGFLGDEGNTIDASDGATAPDSTQALPEDDASPDPNVLKKIYWGFAIEQPKAIEGPLERGTPVAIGFDLTNTAEVDWEDPLVRATLVDSSPDLGVVNLWIESRGESPELSKLEEYFLRDSTRYLLRVWKMEASELSRMPWRCTYQHDIPTDSLPVGAYRCAMEYVSPGGEISRRTHVDFQLNDTVPATPDTGEASEKREPPPARDAVEEAPEEKVPPAEVPPALWWLRKGILGEQGRQKGVAANLAMQPLAWRVASADTHAMSMVNDMRDFSDKLDHLAKVMRLVPPGVLEYGKKIANISKGLDETGPLLWLYGTPTAGRAPVAYLLPSINHDELIQGMQPEGDGMFKDVIAEGKRFKTTAMKDYSAFALKGHAVWLRECAKETGGFDLTLGSLNDFLRRQDICFAMTREFIKEGVSIELPFEVGDYVIPRSMSELADELFDFTGFQAVGGGTAIMPELGVGVSLAAAIDAGSDMGSWSKTMRLHRDDLVAFLPNGPAALVLGVSSCEPWSDWLEDTLKEGCNVRFGEEGDQLSQLVNLDSLRGVTLLVSANPDIGSERIAEQIHLQVHVDDANRALDGSYAFLKGLAALLENHPGALETIDGLNVDRLKRGDQSIVTLEIVDTPAGGQARTFVFSIAPLNQNTLVIQGGDPDRFQAVFSRIAAGNLLHDDPKTRAALNLISADSQQLILCNAGHASKVMNQFAEVAMPAVAEPAARSNVVPDPDVEPNVEPKVEPKVEIKDGPEVAAAKNGEPRGVGGLSDSQALLLSVWAVTELVRPGSGAVIAQAWSGASPADRVRDPQVKRLPAVDQFFIDHALAGFRDVSPVCVGNHFQPTQVELDVVVSEDLLGQVGRLPPIAKEAAFKFLKQSVRDLYEDQFSP